MNQLRVYIGALDFEEKIPGAPFILPILDGQSCGFIRIFLEQGETIEPEEYLAAPLLLFVILLGAILGSVSAEGDEIAGQRR